MLNQLLDLYGNDRRWVNWRVTEDGRKLPVSPMSGKLARSDAVQTWGTYQDALERDKRHVGIMLGPVRKWGGYYLCGIDLDGCLGVNGRLSVEAREIVERWKRYTEVSPSGRGVHVIFAVNTKVVDKLRDIYGINHRKTFSIGAHQEIALDLSNRYYTFTRKVYQDYDMEDMTPMEDLEWLLRDIGPAYQLKSGVKNGVIVGGSGGRSGGRDMSGSGYAQRFFMHLLRSREDTDKDEAVAKLKAEKGRAGEWGRRAPSREIDRTWEQALFFNEHPMEKNGVATRMAIVRRASDITPTDPKFLWYPYVLEGGMCIVASSGGTGKGLWACDLVARETRKRRFFGSTDRGRGRKVVWLEMEDDISSALVPRLRGAGADCSKVDIYAGSDNLARLTREKIIDENIGLIVVSPLLGYLDVRNINDIKEMYTAIEKLVDKVRDLPCTIIGLMHPNKKVDLPAVERILGSVGMPAFVRSVVILRHEDEELNEARMVHAKHNNSMRGPDLIFVKENTRGVDDRGQYIRISWEEAEENISSDKAFDRTTSDGDGVETAWEWLKTHLGDGKRHERSEIIAAGDLRSHSEKAICKAMRRHRDSVDIDLEGFGTEKTSFWQLKSSAKSVTIEPLRSLKKRPYTSPSR
jgi:AAA domain